MKDDHVLLSDQFNIPYIEMLTECLFVKEGIQRIPYSLAKAKQMLPIAEEEGVLIVALANPLDLEALEEVRCLTGQKIREVRSPLSAIEEAISCVITKKRKRPPSSSPP